MNTNSKVLPTESASKSNAVLRLWFLLLFLSAAVFITWLAWPSKPEVPVVELSKADGKPRFWVTNHSKMNQSSMNSLQRLFWDWYEYKRRTWPNPAAYSFPASGVTPCSMGGLLNQCMEVSGTKYLIAVEASACAVDFGHSNTLNGTQWVSAFESTITNQPVSCYDFTLKHFFEDRLVLIRERKNLVKIVPHSKLSEYQKAGLIEVKSVGN